MKNLFLGMTALTALTLTVPAAAQNSNISANVDFGTRIQQLQTRFQAGVQSGAINRTEATPLRQQLRSLIQLERQYRVNGFTAQERSTLQQRIRTLRQQIRVAEGAAANRYDRDRDGDDDRFDRNDDDRDDRFDRNRDGDDDRFDRNNDNRDDRFDRNRDGDDDRYDRDNDGADDRYENRYRRIDRNNDGFDDRDYDRDGRWDDDMIDRNRDGYDDRDTDRDGSWDDDGYPQPAPRGGIGGVIDNLLGTGGLRVGQRAPDNLGGVPYEYRDRYRDSYDSYYRSDGRYIYRIDTRTRTVAQVHSIRR